MAIALVGGTLIDGNGGDPVPNATIVIDRDRISAVGPTNSTAVPNGATRLDVTGKTVMPGLIDGHIHIAGEFKPNVFYPLQGLPTFAPIRAAGAARLLLDAGFTGARSMAGPDYANVALKLGIDLGYVPGPRMISAGPMVRSVGSAGMWSPPTPYPTEPDEMVNGADDARRAVRLQHVHGANFIETTVTGLVSMNGPTPIDRSDWSMDEMRAAVDEAHARQMRIGANAYSDESVIQCIEAGFDVIEHGCMITERGIEALAKSGTYIVPTLFAYNAYVAPDAEQAYPAWRLARGRRVEAQLRTFFAKYLEAGVKVAGGSDGAGPGTGRRPGEGAKELELMVEYGATPMQAIVANTRTVADVMGYLDDFGTIESGKLADLLVIDGDPLRDVRILQDKAKLVGIMKGGEFWRSDLGAQAA